jgi:hypothetical protein
MKQSWDAIVWWEIRRIPYNVTLAILGMMTIGAVLWFESHFAAAGESVLNPLGLIVGVVLYGLAANVFYTLGWVSELLWSGGDTSRTASLRRRVFLIGLAASCAITLSPIVLIPSLWFVFSFPR